MNKQFFSGEILWQENEAKRKPYIEASNHSLSHVSEWASQQKNNKAVYTTAPVAGGWAGAVMSWAGAEMIWAGA